ncbi:MAG: transposase [Pseudomonas sp.]
MAQVVQDCLQPGATISSVAISHGINANVIRKWMPLYRGAASSIAAGFCGIRHGPEVEVDSEQLQALVVGLPWQRVDAGGSITVL